MKKLTALLLKFSLVLSGVMILTNHVDATKKDVQSAMNLIAQARTAIGGDNALNQIQSLAMHGTSTRTFQIEGQPERQINGEFELAMMQPDGLFRIEKLGMNHDGADVATPDDDAAAGNRVIRIETRDKVAAPGQGEPVADVHLRQNDELTRYMVGLLLTAPAKANVTYDYIGDGNVDGAKADIIAVGNQDGSVMKLYLDKNSHLPLMMTHQGYDLPPMIALHSTSDAGDGERRIVIRKAPGDSTNGDADVVFERRGDVPATAGAADGEQRIVIRKVPGDAANGGADVVLERRGDGPVPSGNGQVMIFKHDGQVGTAQPGAGEPGVFRIAMPAPKEVEIQTRFADYRMVNGVMLPHRLTQTVNGKQTEVLTVTGYEINSPATAEKFAEGQVRFVRKARD